LTAGGEEDRRLSRGRRKGSLRRGIAFARCGEGDTLDGCSVADHRSSWKRWKRRDIFSRNDSALEIPSLADSQYYLVNFGRAKVMIVMI
jgi:hypothetical protein